MKPLDSGAVLENLKWRYATKRFDPKKKISAAELDVLEQAMVLSPSSFGLQPWKFFFIDSPELRAKLRAESWNQPQVVEASHFVVFAVRKNMNRADVERHINQVASVRGLKKESLADYQKMMVEFVEATKPGFDVTVWASRQVYIALGTLLTTAAMLGVDACPMEGFSSAGYDKILGLEAEGYSALVLCALGYRSADDSYAALPKVRFDRADTIKRL